MTVYVLGAGASVHAGYPLANDMAKKLLAWMKRPVYDPGSYAARYSGAAEYLEKSFPSIENIEDLIAGIRQKIRELAGGTEEQRVKRAKIGAAYGVLQNAVRDWFGAIQRSSKLDPTYREFAKNVISDGDCIITFNYDVSFERELKHAGKFEIGDGYGFPMEGLPVGSKTKMLKLHGSTSWLALLFGGVTAGFSSFAGNTLSSPVIGTNELLFLGYDEGVVDPRFKNGGAALPVMIFPAPLKEFYFDVNTGVEYHDFWDRLWHQAREALHNADSVVICGYSLQNIDERAHGLLLSAPKKDTEVLVAAGTDTQRVAGDYLNAGYSRAAAASEPRFEDWVAKMSSSVAVTR